MGGLTQKPAYASNIVDTGGTFQHCCIWGTWARRHKKTQRQSFQMTSYELVGRITIELHDVPVKAALLHDVHFLRRRERLLIQLYSSLEEVIS